MVINLLLVLAPCLAYSQDSTFEKYTLLGFSICLEKQILSQITEECDAVINEVSLSYEEEELFKETICTPDVEDVLLVREGYITIIEHYSSPVGWSRYFVFDLCQRKVIKTKRLDEGTELNWGDFIKLDSLTKEEYVDEIIAF